MHWDDSLSHTNQPDKLYYTCSAQTNLQDSPILKLGFIVILIQLLVCFLIAIKRHDPDVRGLRLRDWGCSCEEHLETTFCWWCDEVSAMVLVMLILTWVSIIIAVHIEMRIHLFPFIEKEKPTSALLLLILLTCTFQQTNISISKRAKAKARFSAGSGLLCIVSRDRGFKISYKIQKSKCALCLWMD